MSCSEQVEELTIPDKIRSRRKAAGFSSQEALGAAIGTTRLHVNSWETGRHSPSEKYAAKLASVLGGTADEYQNHDGPRRRAEDVLVERVEAVAAGMAETNLEILRLLTEIRNEIVRPARLAGGSSPESAQ